MSTENNLMTERSGVAYNTLVALVAALGGYVFGFQMSIIAGPLIFLAPYFSLTESQQEWIVGSFLIGCVIGSALAGTASDIVGRKKVLIASAVFFLTSAIVSAASRNTTELFVGRCIGGLGVGIVCMLSPMYIAEISRAKSRGLFVLINQLALVIGISSAYIVSWVLATWGTENWRYMFGSGAIPALVFLIAMFKMPESPRWLAKQGSVDEARAILARIGGHKHAEAEMMEIQNALRHEGASFWELFKPGIRVAMLIGIVLPFIDQSTGINVIIHYSPTILQQTQQDEVSALAAAIPISLVNIVGTIFAMLVIDKIGRRPLALVGLTGMCISLVLLGFTFESGEPSSGWLVGTLMVTYIAFYAIGLGAVVFLLAAEIFPTRTRGRAMSVFMVVEWLWCAVFSMTFLTIGKVFGISGAFWLYAAMCVLAWIFIWKVVPETKGKSLEEIEALW